MGVDVWSRAGRCGGGLPPVSVLSGRCGAPLLNLDGFLTGQFWNENVLPLEAAFLDHLDGIFEPAQLRLGVVGAEGELGARGFRGLDKRWAGDLVFSMAASMTTFMRSGVQRAS